MNKQDWVITEIERDSYDLSKGNKVYLKGVSLTQVRKFLRRKISPREKVVRIEEDGYKFNDTSRYQRMLVRR